MSAEEPAKVAFEDPVDWIYLGCALACVTSAALAAGLTMGLLSLDTLKLKIKTMTGSEEEQSYARAILPLLHDRHFLLCSLLVFNAAANEALPIFLDELLPSWAAVVFSVTLVLIFGEVVPTALFTGPQQLKIAYKFSGIVRVIQFCLYPVARPMAMGLDRFLGDDHDKEEMYTRDEIAAMVRILRSKGAGVQEMGSPRGYTSPQGIDGEEATTVAPLHVDAAVLEAFDDLGKRPTRTWQEQQTGMLQSATQNVAAVEEDASLAAAGGEDSPLTYGEVNVITGVLGLAKLCIADVLVPLDQVNMLSTDHVMDQATVDAIYNVGHSRLPVCNGSDPKDVIGVFLVKRLVQLNPENAIPLQSLEIRELLVVGSSQSLLDVLTIFQQGQSHIAVVSNVPDELKAALAAKQRPEDHCAPIGIVTIEDIFEAMIQSKIYDEADYEDRDDKQHDQGTEALKVLQVPRDTTKNDDAALHASTLSNFLSGAGGSKDPNFVHPYKVNQKERTTSSDIAGASGRTEQAQATASSVSFSKKVNHTAKRHKVEFRDKKSSSSGDDLESGRGGDDIDSPRAPPTLLHSHSNPSGHSSATDLNTLEQKLLSDDARNAPPPQLRKAQSTGSAHEYGSKVSELDKMSLSRKYDSLFDEMGVPLIHDKMGNAPSAGNPKVNSARTGAGAGAGAAGGQQNMSRFPASATSTLKPSMLAKYIKTRRYSITDS